jgi:hypothetical protein
MCEPPVARISDFNLTASSNVSETLDDLRVVTVKVVPWVAAGSWLTHFIRPHSDYERLWRTSPGFDPCSES